MTRDKLQARLEQLHQEHERHVADAHATWGAIQDCEFWLEQLGNTQQPVEAELVEPKENI